MMMDVRHGGLIARLIIILLMGEGIPSESAGQAFTWPDASEGVINGQQALMAWPVQDDKLADPTGCTVHLVSGRNQSEEQVYPCARWFVPVGGGSFDYWIEQGDTISPSQGLLRYSGTPGAALGARVGVPFIPGGRVLVKSRIAAGETLRLLSLSAPELGFERRVVGVDRFRTGILMPAGSLIVGVFNEAGEALKLSAPLELKPGTIIEAEPRRQPPDRAALLIVLRGYSRTGPGEIRAVFTQGGEKQRPDLLRATKTRVFAVWYDLDPVAGHLTLEGDGVQFESAVQLTAGETKTLRSDLRK